VYLAEYTSPSTQIRRQVALKEVNGAANTLEKIFAFRREAYIMSQLSHANVVQFYGISTLPDPGDRERRFGLVMELLPGGDLQQLLEKIQFGFPKEDIHMKEGETIPKLSVGGEPTKLAIMAEDATTYKVDCDGRTHRVPKDVITLSETSPLPDKDIPWTLRMRIALDIANGMNALHSLSPPLIHRDLRSPNVFIVSHDHAQPVVAKVADFGLSVWAEPNFRGLLGTFQWLPPEVISPEEQNYDEKCDVYSFAMVLHEICTRSIPITEEYWDRFCRNGHFDRHSCIRAIVEEDLRPSKSADTPLPVYQLMCLCWQKNPRNRPSFTTIAFVLNTLYRESLLCENASFRNFNVDVDQLVRQYLTKPAVRSVADLSLQQTGVRFQARAVGSCSQHSFGRSMLVVENPMVEENWIRLIVAESPFQLCSWSVERFLNPSRDGMGDISEVTETNGSFVSSGCAPDLLPSHTMVRVSGQGGDFPSVIFFHIDGKVSHWDSRNLRLVNSPLSCGLAGVRSAVLRMAPRQSRLHKKGRPSFEVWAGDASGTLKVWRNTWFLGEESVFASVTLRHSVRILLHVPLRSSPMVWVSGRNGQISRIDCLKFSVIDTLVHHSGHTLTDMLYIDGEVWSAASDHTIAVWDSQTVELMYTFNLGATSIALRLSKQRVRGQYYVIAVCNDGYVVAWNARSKAVVARANVKSSEVSCVASAGKGRGFFSAYKDGEIFWLSLT